MDKVRYGIIGIGKQGGGYAAALAKGEDCEGVDLIYLPERVFDLD